MRLSHEAFNTGSSVLHYCLRTPLVDTHTTLPTLVFLNALGSDNRIWDDVVAGFPEFSCLIYDKRGHGLSCDAPNVLTMQDHADDVLALLDGLGLSDVILVGVSIGGMIAQLAASQKPQRVRALVLCCTGLKIGNTESWQQRITAVLKDGTEAIADSIIARWFSSAFLTTQADKVALYRTMLARIPAQNYAASCFALRDADLTHRSAKLTMPTLCVSGSEDVSTPPALVQTMADIIKNAQHKIIQGVGHLPMLETPELLTTHIREFFMQMQFLSKGA